MTKFDIEEAVTRVKGMLNASVEAIRQEEKDVRERAQETCPRCGGLADRETVVTSSDGDTAVELVCRSAKCGWRT